MNILILGGAGFFGANLARRCLQEPSHVVTVLDSLEPCLQSDLGSLKDVWEQIRFVQGDLRDARLMESLVAGQDIIFNCAAQSSHPLSLSNPLLDASINCVGNLTLLEAVRRVNPRARIVYASSTTVIGKTRLPTADEDHPEHPLDIYSANKGVAEKYYSIYHQVHDVPTVVLRFPNLYGRFGKGTADFGFVNFFIDRALKDEVLDVFRPGTQLRNVLYIEDAVEIMFRAASLDTLAGRSLLAVHTEHLSVRQIAGSIVGTLGRGRVNMIPWPEERRRIEIGDVRLCGEKLYKLADWKPRYCFEEGLRHLKSTIREATPSTLVKGRR